MGKKSIAMDVPPSKVQFSYKNCEYILRPYAVQDAPAIVAAIQESLPELHRFMPWSHAEGAMDLDAQRKRLVDRMRAYWSNEDFVFGLFSSDNKIYFGSFGLHRRTLNTHALEIGFWLHSKYAGQGITTHVTKVLIALCFEYFACDRVQCGFRDGNIGSQRVFEKVGFRMEGKLTNFETAPTPEMLAKGYVMSRSNNLGGLLNTDIPNLSWYKDVLASLSVYDWLGERV